MTNDFNSDLAEAEAQIPRFRIVVELSLPSADPFSPSDYDELFVKWQELLETNTKVVCKDVRIREICTIGDEDDFDE